MKCLSSQVLDSQFAPRNYDCKISLEIMNYSIIVMKVVVVNCYHIKYTIEEIQFNCPHLWSQHLKISQA